MFAHVVGGDALPAPPWLLSYIGIALVLGTAASLRVTWPRRAVGADRARATGGHRRSAPGHVVGLVLYAGAVAVAIIGPDSSAANLAPWLVPVVWWVGLPIVCLLLGDVVRHLNPFVPLVALLDRGRPSDPERRAAVVDRRRVPRRVVWYLLAYHRPGSPRALAVFLIAYALAAVAGGLRVGTAVAGDAARPSARCRRRSPASACAGGDGGRRCSAPRC